MSFHLFYYWEISEKIKLGLNQRKCQRFPTPVTYFPLVLERLKEKKEFCFFYKSRLKS